MKQIPRVGVGVIIINGGKVLLGKRKNSIGHGTWFFPGGHLEFGESPTECAEREVREETGLQVKNIRQGPYTNDFYVPEQFSATEKQYIMLYILADYVGGEPELRESENCEGWQWFAWDKLPEPLFLPLANLVRSGFRV